MTLSINGVDMIPYIAQRGVKWQRSDLDAEDSGRTLDGVMHRGRVATKIRLDITCTPLRSSDAQTVLNAILPEFVSVTYTDPMLGLVSKTMYSNNNPASFLMIDGEGVEWWEGITFPLIEQ